MLQVASEKPVRNNQKTMIRLIVELAFLGRAGFREPSFKYIVSFGDWISS
jgi:hypothetical protein